MACTIFSSTTSICSFSGPAGLCPAFSPRRNSHSFKTTLSHLSTDHLGAAPQDSTEEPPNTIRLSLFQRLRIHPALRLSRSRSRGSARADDSPASSEAPSPSNEGSIPSPNVFAPPEPFSVMISSSLMVTPPAPPSKRQRSRESRTLSSRSASRCREADDGPPPSPGLRIPAFLTRTKAGWSSPCQQN